MHIVKWNLLDTHIVLAGALVDMYVRCGEFEKAIEVFDKLPVHDVVSWNVLIGGYAQHGYNKQALKCFYDMQARGVCPNPITFSFVLKVCSNVGDLEMGEKLQTQILREHMSEQDIGISNAVIDMYSRCGSLIKAREVFNAVSKKNTATWNALIAGYCQHGHYEEALGCFRQMQLEGCSPNAVTLASVLTSCGSAGALDQGQEIHMHIVKWNLLDTHIVLAGALVDMYVRCGEFEKAIEVFDKLPVHDVVSWNVLIGGYAQHGYNKQALKCFYDMQARGVCPNPITFSFVLKVCSNVGDLEMGEKLQTQILREHMSEQDIGISNAVIDMYSRCGSLIKAREVFNAVSKKNTATWNALIAGYCQHGHYEEALGCFRQMQLEGFRMDEITTSCMFKVCGNLRALDEGNAIHLQAVKEGLLQGDVVGTNALIDIYTKCNALGGSTKCLR
ncbi:hypothetical protein KP509_12G035100 [Ceratopteris richardii]|uniref:Pentatricopeptide repeat-containing protein n=1 Tax=Ceratopteris richardii TaxID=49495 RepID=A0A8T2TKK1_CERRI|nr:hypothetical protein KP509_12G035100 [Ceratopteris richardii]